MKVPVKDFVNTFKDIYYPKPWPYLLGQSGKTMPRKSDCVGAVMYAIDKLGAPRYAIHGSNYAARQRVSGKGLISIRNASDLSYGQLVFKHRAPNHPRYNLPARYKPGGQYHKGDLNDYYHVGVVVRTVAQGGLQIIHSTGPESKLDTKLGSNPGWTYAAYEKYVDYESTVNKIKDPEFPDVPFVPQHPNKEAYMKATVSTPDKLTLNIREDKSSKAKILGRIPHGQQIEVIDKGATWSTVNLGGKPAYVMSKFLVFEDTPDVPPSPIDPNQPITPDIGNTLPSYLYPQDDIADNLSPANVQHYLNQAEEALVYLRRYFNALIKQ